MYGEPGGMDENAQAKSCINFDLGTENVSTQEAHGISSYPIYVEAGLMKTSSQRHWEQKATICQRNEVKLRQETIVHSIPEDYTLSSAPAPSESS